MKDMTKEVRELGVLYRRSLVFSIIFDDQLYRSPYLSGVSFFNLVRMTLYFFWSSILI